MIDDGFCSCQYYITDLT